jgi:hypothetical protein
LYEWKFIFNLDLMMIFSNQNLQRNPPIHLLTGKLLIVKLQQKILVIMEIIVQIIVVQLLIPVVTGKDHLVIKHQIIFYKLVQHRNQHQQQQHLMTVVMHKNVFLMLKEYQVINFLIKILM